MESNSTEGRGRGTSVLVDGLKGVAHFNQEALLVRHDADLVSAVKQHFLALRQPLAVDERAVA